jgi:ketosteroid isomerase-like protein
MKRILVAAILAVGIVAVQADAKEDLQKLYNSLAAAVKKKDAKACLGFLTADYKDIDIKGKAQTRKEFEKTIKDQFAQPVTVSKFEITVTKVMAKGADLEAENTAKMAVSITLSDKKVHKLEQTSTSRDTWTKVNGKWLLKTSKTLTQKKLLDGKEIKG